MPKGGRPRQLSSRTVLLGVMLALDAGRPAQLKAAWRALSQLSLVDKGNLGVVAAGPSGGTGPPIANMRTPSGRSSKRSTPARCRRSKASENMNEPLG